MKKLFEGAGIAGAIGLTLLFGLGISGLITWMVLGLFGISVSFLKACAIGFCIFFIYGMIGR